MLESAEKMPDVVFDFYGDIDGSFSGYFNTLINKLPNVSYRGVFKSGEYEKYVLLHSYDAMLLPTKWINEGTPGIIVESKIAGIIPIVSNQNYNAELVYHNIDGIVLSNTDSTELESAIEKIQDEYDTYLRLRVASHKSAEKYYIEEYIILFLNKKLTYMHGCAIIVKGDDYGKEIRN